METKVSVEPVKEAKTEAKAEVLVEIQNVRSSPELLPEAETPQVEQWEAELNVEQKALSQKYELAKKSDWSFGADNVISADEARVIQELLQKFPKEKKVERLCINFASPDIRLKA